MASGHFVKSRCTCTEELSGNHAAAAERRRAPSGPRMEDSREASLTHSSAQPDPAAGNFLAAVSCKDGDSDQPGSYPCDAHGLLSGVICVTCS